MTAIDRSVPLSAWAFGARNPSRVHVVGNGTGPRTDFAVWRGTEHLRDVPTFDEAIRWAQKAADDQPRPMEAP